MEKKMSAEMLAVLKVLQENRGVALTLAEINEKAGTNVKSGTVVGLMRGNLITKGDDKEVEYIAKKKVGTYKID